MSAHTRRLDRPPSAPMSNAVSRPPKDSEMMRVEFSTASDYTMRRIAVCRRIEHDRPIFAAMLGGPDRLSLFMLAAE